MILKNEQLNYKQIEALEEILKRIQFRLIDLENCNLDEDVSRFSEPENGGLQSSLFVT